MQKPKQNKNGESKQNTPTHFSISYIQQVGDIRKNLCRCNHIGGQALLRQSQILQNLPNPRSCNIIFIFLVQNLKSK